jgi:hypothetical protein
MEISRSLSASMIQNPIMVNTIDYRGGKIWQPWTQAWASARAAARHAASP